ncbi:mitogen-activated protein kinase HOG1 [Colletotrichum abscissum]|uniref:Mitogen-activated protein kinase HOG1 n=2 Tax=Colletotrichum abscissum TaxID=1671311 RepID=A0A9Q0B0E3_9PEZI|nr:mitogen-activated protein kinase HOG1 [Colletotrichum abscissum]
MATNTGTTGYTAPEVLLSGSKFHGNYTSKADLWSLGCVVYRMIKGEQILEHDDETKREAENKVKGLAEKDWEEFPSPEAGLLQKLLCIDPEKRSDAECALKSYRKSRKL